MPNTVYVAPATRGNGDGSSAANAHRYNGSSADQTWLQGVLSGWVAELTANPSDMGLNEAHTVNTVKPGFESGYNDVDTDGNSVPVKAYVTDARSAVWARRVCFLSDVGEYAIPSGQTGSWFTLSPSHWLPAPVTVNAGASGQPVLRRVHFVAYRSSDGQRADQVAGGTETRSVTLPAKSGNAAAMANAANYTTDGQGYRKWTGATTTVTKTWTVQLPSPIRAVIRGNRTSDPRGANEKHTKQWCVSLAAADKTFTLRDPTSNGVEGGIVVNGANVALSGGQVFNPANNTVTNGPAIVAGPTAFFSGASGVGYQGFEFRDMSQPFSHNGAVATRFVSYLDLRIDNARYINLRGDQRYDLEFARLHLTSVSQKALVPGINCQRWHISNVYSDGQLCVADRIQSLISSPNGDDTNAFNAGAFRFENLIVEYMWDALPSGSTYVQGDGIDSEVKGQTIRNMWCDLTGDGGIDNKPTPYWTNWPAVSVFNTYLSRNKRAFRSWPSVQDRQAVAPHVLRDVVVADARQYGLFMVGSPGHHKFVDWWNPSGVANFTNPAGRTYTAVSNDGTAGGDMDAVIHQLYDARSAGGLTSGMNANTALGGLVAPFRAKLRTPITPSRPLRMQIDGVEVDDGQPVVVTSGQGKSFAPTNLPSGSTIGYRLTGQGTVSTSGLNATVTPSGG